MTRTSQKAFGDDWYSLYLRDNKIFRRRFRESQIRYATSTDIEEKSEIYLAMKEAMIEGINVGDEKFLKVYKDAELTHYDFDEELNNQFRRYLAGDVGEVNLDTLTMLFHLSWEPEIEELRNIDDNPDDLPIWKNWKCLYDKYHGKDDDIYRGKYIEFLAVSGLYRTNMELTSSLISETDINELEETVDRISVKMGGVPKHFLEIVSYEGFRLIH